MNPTTTPLVNTRLLVKFTGNKYKKAYITVAEYCLKYTQSVSDNAPPNWGDYSEKDDQYYAPEGWYTDHCEHCDQQTLIDDKMVWWKEL